MTNFNDMTINFSGKRLVADQYTLNFVSMLAQEAAKEYDRDGHIHMAKEARDFARHIYNELEKAGTYKNF